MPPFVSNNNNDVLTNSVEGSIKTWQVLTIINSIVSAAAIAGVIFLLSRGAHRPRPAVQHTSVQAQPPAKGRRHSTSSSTEVSSSSLGSSAQQGEDAKKDDEGKIMPPNPFFEPQHDDDHCPLAPPADDVSPDVSPVTRAMRTAVPQTVEHLEGLYAGLPGAAMRPSVDNLSVSAVAAGAAGAPTLPAQQPPPQLGGLGAASSLPAIHGSPRGAAVRAAAHMPASPALGR